MTEITAINEREVTKPVQSDRSRWIALVVLCVGMLMIVLDQTIVNVALPSIKDDLGLLAVDARLGRQRLPDHLRRPAACSPAASAT